MKKSLQITIILVALLALFQIIRVMAYAIVRLPETLPKLGSFQL